MASITADAIEGPIEMKGGASPPPQRIEALDFVRGLALFRPVEWPWRGLAYMKLQPMRRKVAA